MTPPMMMPKQNPVKSGAADGAELRASEAEFLAPVVKNAAADGEAHAGGENGHESSPEEAGWRLVRYLQFLLT